MRRHHLESLAPLCPRCRRDGRLSPLALLRVSSESEEIIQHGALGCTDPGCAAEYPIIDGLPVLVPDLRSFLAENYVYLAARDDLPEATESLLTDALGPGSFLDAQMQALSTYGRDHYGDLDPRDPARVSAPGTPAPGAVLRLLDRALGLLPALPDGPVADLGCAVGRTSLHLAERLDRPVIGLDLSVPMLRVAAGALGGQVRYPVRRVGMVYDRREIAARFAGAPLVDYWLGDALDPPLADGGFALVVALNLIDCVRDPAQLLARLAGLLRPSGVAILATPFDWSGHATPVENWVGGHSQRGTDRGSSEERLARLTTRHFDILSEDEVDWPLRLHDRSVILYKTHMMIGRRAP